MASDFLYIPAYGSASWKSPVSTALALPLIGNSPGDTRAVLDTDTIYIWTGTMWTVSGPSGVTSLNSLTGALSIVAGANVTVTPSGSSITVAASQGAVQAVEVQLTASSAVSVNQMVIATSSTQAAPGNNNTTIENASVLGIAKTGASMGNTFTALLFGTITDASFSSFSINSPVYLNSSGLLTQTLPVAPNFLVNCGKYLGSNTVFINIEQPVQL